MELYIGTDLIEIERIREAIARWGDRFLKRVYTAAELELYRGNVPSLAARFAGKEAVIKALSPQLSPLAWKEIEILACQTGKPFVNLYGGAEAEARRLGLAKLEISLSHSREMAMAFVVGTYG